MLFCLRSENFQCLHFSFTSRTCIVFFQLKRYHDKCVSTSMIYLMLFTLKWTRRVYHFFSIHKIYTNILNHIYSMTQGLHSPHTYSVLKPVLCKHMKNGKNFMLCTDVSNWKPTQRHKNRYRPKGLFYFKRH